MTFKRFANVLLNTHTIMEKIAKSATCQATGTSLPLSAKDVHKKATMISSLRNALPVQITIHFGMAPFAPNVPSKVQSGMVSTATIALQDNTGTSLYRNAFHVHQVKSTILLRINVSVLLKRLLCLQMELVSPVINPNTGTKGTKSALFAVKVWSLITKDSFVYVQKEAT
jgi:hypothetical protein